MKNRWLDTLLLLALFATLFTNGQPFHSLMGFLFAVLLTLHVLSKRKWLIAVGKTIRKRKGNRQLKQKYSVAILMLGTWYAAIISAMAAIQFHGPLVAFSLLLTVIHLWQNRTRIKNILFIKSSSKAKFR